MLPEARKILVETIVRESPGWAEQLSGQLQESLPDARQELENYVVAQMDTLLKESSALTEEQFRGFLIENRATLEKGFEDLSASPEMAEQTMTEVTHQLDSRLSRQMQEDASRMLDTLFEMDRKLVRLSENKNLTREQLLERRILMLTRRLQLETVEPNAPDELASPPRKPRARLTSDVSVPDDEPDQDESNKTPDTDESESPPSPVGDQTPE
jgi:hypothetical protein